MKHGTKKKSNVKEVILPSDFGIVLESVDSKIDQIIEEYDALDKKIDIHHGEFHEFRKEVYKFDVVFDELHLIRNDLKEKVSRDEFVLLEKRVLALERKNR